MGLVACADIVVAVDAAGFCLSEAKLGLLPATIGPYVVRALGEQASRRYFVTAERFRGAHTTLEHLARERVDQHKHERSVLERLEMVTKKREDGASVAVSLRSVA